jgi:hypothetical protein
MEVFTNPLIIPLGAFAVAIVAIVAGIVGQAHSRRLKAEQRMAMVARGVPAEQIERLLGSSEEEEKPVRRAHDPLRSLNYARRTGIVLVSTGVGVVIFFLTLTAILQHRAILAGAAAGLIPLAIGIGFFIDYNMQKRDLKHLGLEVELPPH